MPTANGSKKYSVAHTLLSYNLIASNMEVVIFEEENVTIKRKKAQPSPDYSTVGNKDNKVTLIFEDGDVYLKVCNPESGLVYIYSQIRSTTNPDFNLINSRGVHLILLVPSLKPEPSPYVFIFNE